MTGRSWPHLRTNSAALAPDVRILKVARAAAPAESLNRRRRDIPARTAAFFMVELLSEARGFLRHRQRQARRRRHRIEPRPVVRRNIRARRPFRQETVRDRRENRSRPLLACVREQRHRLSARYFGPWKDAAARKSRRIFEFPPG